MLFYDKTDTLSSVYLIKNFYILTLYGFALRIRKQAVPGDVVQPPAASVMADDPGPFDKFIGAEEKIHPHDRKPQEKGGQKSQRHCVSPHVDGIAEEAEAAVPSGPEDAGDQHGIDGDSHDIIGIDQEHVFQVMHGLRSQVCISQDKGRGCQDDQTAQKSGEYG